MVFMELIVCMYYRYMALVSYEPGPVYGSLLTRQHEHRLELIWREHV